MANFGYSNEWKEELKQRNDIVSTISRYIKLDRKGKNFWGICPFHYEKTPSFCVSETDQFYKCFGCGESGDVISFVQKYEGVDFVEAVKILAKDAGMEIPELESSDKTKKQKEEKDKILQALRMAAIFYNKTLKSESGKPAMEYLQKRGVTQKSITTFGIGYSKDFESVKTELLKTFPLEILKKAGILDTASNGRTYDAYAERLIFPLINAYGDVVGFSGRIIVDKPFAKYKNTAQTSVFDKSRVIFGINLIKKLRNELHGNVPQVILVEGQLDVVSMHQNGFNTAVACLGTALTPLHTKELKRMTDNIVVLLDGDGAGQKATMRSVDILRPSGLSVRVATLPEGLDPDEFLKKYGKEAMQKILDNAMDATEFQLQYLAKNFNLSQSEQRAKYIKVALGVIKNLETDAEKAIYLETVRKLTAVPVDILRQDLSTLKTDEVEQTQEVRQEETLETDAYILAEKFILASLLFRKSWANLKDTENINFMLPDAKIIYDYVKTGTPEKPALVGGVFGRIDVENSPFAQSVINFGFNDEIGASEWKDCIFKLLERSLKIKKDELEKRIKSADVNERKELAKALFEIDMRLAKMKNKI